jgi:hypothetical protein
MTAASPPRGGYLLDTGIVLGFQKCGHLDALTGAAGLVSLTLVEEVFDEITDPRGGKHAAEANAAKSLFAESKLGIRGIPIGSPAAATLWAIRRGKTSTADLGEAASIALALHDRDLTFVTNDAAASLKSLTELRGRTLSFHPFLAALVEAGAVGVERSDEIAGAIRGLRDWGAVEPTWWSSWLTDQRTRTGATTS